MKKDRLLRTIYRILFVTPLILGIGSYLYTGESFADALYNSIRLYGLNYEKPAVPIIWLEIARWLAPVMTATSVIVVVKSLSSFLSVHVRTMGKNGHVVYGDSVYAEALCENEKKAVLCKAEPISYAKNHFIMFDSELENLSFCQKYRKRMKKKNIYVCMHEMNDMLLKKLGADSKIKFFHPNDVIARSFWKERRLWMDAPQEYRIAIIGFGSLGKRLLEKSLQLNLFSVDQKVQYYIFGDAKHFRVSHSHTGMQLMNQDQLLFFDENSEEQWEQLENMDMIILTENTDMNLIQKVLYSSKPTCEVYYYSPKVDKLCDFIETDRLYPYGRMDKVFTLENIKTDKLYQNAIELNQQYVERYHSAEWEELNGFLRNSNISAADYGEVIRALLQKGVSDTELAELEHIRWCRFSFLHYWKYGVPENGRNKDEDKKIHKCLVPFGELEAVEKEKDLEVIQMWKNVQ